MENIGEFLSYFQQVKQRKPTEWMALCPAHKDIKPSLSIGIGEDDRVILHCHANCATQEILANAGLQMTDLFLGNRPKEDHSKKKIVATYDYTDEEGELLYQAVRFEPKEFRQRKPDSTGGWIWNLGGTRKVLYRLPQLVNSPYKTVYLLEGEKDADNFCELGLIATTNAMGAGKWLPEYSAALAGRDVVIIRDNDKAGKEHGEKVAGELLWIAKRVRILDLPDLSEHGDGTEWLTACRAKGMDNVAICRELARLTEKAFDFTASKKKKKMFNIEVDVFGTKFIINSTVDISASEIVDELIVIGLLMGQCAFDLESFQAGEFTPFRIECGNEFAKTFSDWMIAREKRGENEIATIEEIKDAMTVLGVMPQWLAENAGLIARLAKADQVSLEIAANLSDDCFRPIDRTFAELKERVCATCGIEQSSLVDALKLMRQRGSATMRLEGKQSIWSLTV